MTSDHFALVSSCFWGKGKLYYLILLGLEINLRGSRYIHQPALRMNYHKGQGYEHCSKKQLATGVRFGLVVFWKESQRNAVKKLKWENAVEKAISQTNFKKSRIKVFSPKNSFPTEKAFSPYVFLTLNHEPRLPRNVESLPFVFGDSDSSMLHRGQASVHWYLHVLDTWRPTYYCISIYVHHLFTICIYIDCILHLYMYAW